MERKTPQADRKKWERLIRISNEDKGLLGALAGRTVFSATDGWLITLTKCLQERHGKPLGELTVEEFYAPWLIKALETLAGPELAEKIPQIAAMAVEGQFSTFPWRRSYRSRHFAYHLRKVLDLTCNLIRYACYQETVAQRLTMNPGIGCSFEYILALELRQNNQEAVSLIREAIYGDNSQVVLTHEMIRAIFISGHETLLDDLMKLLLAAKLQEGLRQEILQAADCGSTQSLMRVLKVCIDENLLRFSSAIRAFDVWTGLGYGDQKPAQLKKYAALAYECLAEESKRREYLDSENNVESYFALWAQGCWEIQDTMEMLPRLLEDPRHYRRCLGWLFVTRSDNARFRMEMASRYLEEEDPELMAWVVSNLARSWGFVGTNWNSSGNTSRRAVPNPALPNTVQERRALFARLRLLAQRIGNKKQTFSGNPFDFVAVNLESGPVYDCMMSLAGYDMDDALVEQLLELAPKMSTDQRCTLIRGFLLPETKESHRVFLWACLADRSIYVKDLAVAHLRSCTLTREDLDHLAQALKSKSSDFRGGILEIFKKQSLELLSPLVGKMLESSDENQNQAAIELLMENPKLMKAHRPGVDALQQRKISTQTQILLDQLLGTEEEKEELYTPENGYGLFDPQVVESYRSAQPELAPKLGLMTRIFGKNEELLPAKEVKNILPTEVELERLMVAMDNVFQRHAGDEIEIERISGTREKVLFGDMRYRLDLPADSGYHWLGESGSRLEMVPFWEEFREALGDYAANVKKMLGLVHLTARSGNSWSQQRFFQKNYELWYLPIVALELAPRLTDSDFFTKYKRTGPILEIIRCLPQLHEPHLVFTETLRIYRSMIAILGRENLYKTTAQVKSKGNVIYNAGHIPQPLAINDRMLTTWRGVMERLDLNREDFAAWFALEYPLEGNAPGPVEESLGLEAYFRAVQEGIVPRDILLDYFMTGKERRDPALRILTNPTRWPEGRRIYEKYPVAKELVPQLVDRMVSVEEKRGELPTAVSLHCLGIHRFEGAAHFAALLAALGKESFHRGYEYSRATGKKESLSRLLKRCYPAPEDTPEALGALLKATDISDKRLAEAAMYAPQWAGFAEEILGWPGLKCGIWFFHAHINETFSAEKETQTAIYSPISPQQFNDGAFDKNWFFEAYNQLGEKRFQVLYKCAKYITSGSNQHRRSQLYSDAVLGKLDAKALMQEITEKRNQEKLRCYPLIPIAQGDTQEPLRRYEFLQKFLKESKQFGAQRRDSEKKACNTALENLAITTGIGDVNRLMWQMESQKLDALRPLMEPVSVEGVSLYLTIDESGEALVVTEKNGKPLKTAPKSIAKNEYFLELKAAAKDLKELKRRSRESLERAMTEATEFGAGELKNILTNPVLAPMVRALVWTDGENLGFLTGTERGICLTPLTGESTQPETLRIAHPHDMRLVGQWAQFMHLLYEKQLVQPFKQVFREYYPLTQDEKQERTISRRYAGHQVQPQRTVALLKGRGWTVDYEEGLQKVFYKEDLIVRMFALADWFSPADIEAPTLETVEFFHRRTGRNVPLEEIPPILFSETMRDLDLVVSVAHVGGVDPEASHSTVEMRAAIVQELAKLLKLDNVTWIGSHARIRGSLANYSVHLGSGVVHGEGMGAISLLPVHSQARGRIFLPFADDDPKTAEIMSKILLLAEDKKIKDPTILNQLR